LLFQLSASSLFSPLSKQYFFSILHSTASFPNSCFGSLYIFNMHLYLLFLPDFSFFSFYYKIHYFPYFVNTKGRFYLSYLPFISTYLKNKKSAFASTSLISYYFAFHTSMFHLKYNVKSVLSIMSNLISFLFLLANNKPIHSLRYSMFVIASRNILGNSFYFIAAISHSN